MGSMISEEPLLVQEFTESYSLCKWLLNHLSIQSLSLWHRYEGMQTLSQVKRSQFAKISN